MPSKPSINGVWIRIFKGHSHYTTRRQIVKAKTVWRRATSGVEFSKVQPRPASRLTLTGNFLRCVAIVNNERKKKKIILINLTRWPTGRLGRGIILTAIYISLHNEQNN